MRIWSTFRYVPAIAPEAMAWATLSFATYLAAVESPTQIGARELDPLALALAVQMVLMFTKNAVSVKFAAVFRESPWMSTAIMGCGVAGLGVMALFAPAETVVRMLVAYYSIFAAILFGFALLAPEDLPKLHSAWGQLKRFRTGAVLLEAGGYAVIAATLWTVWTFAGALAFAAMMSFGTLVLRVMINWVIVLYLLDREARREPGD